MAAVAITAQNTRLDDAEALTDWGNIGSGPGRALETDFKYQGSNCVARKGATALRGIFLSDNVDSDLSGAGTYETVMFKFICTTPGLLDLLSVPGLALRVGSGSITATPSVDYHFYDLEGSDTYPIDKSWLILPIDLNIASHRSGTVGTPGLTVVDFYALVVDQTGVSKSPNYALDAVDIGAGLTLTGGDGADTDGVWQDFSDDDFGTVANRYGYVRENEGVFIVYGKMIIGTATATVFNDSGQDVIFPEGLFAAGFSGVQVGLASATTDVDFATTKFTGKGTKAGEDTRPVFTVIGTAGAFDADMCTWDNHATLTLTSGVTLLLCTIANSEKLIQAGATLDGTIIFGATTADGVAFIESDDPSKIKNSSFTFSDGHAIEITTPGTYNVDNNTFIGYGADGTNDAAFFNDSGGAVTLNLINGSSGVTVRNGVSASTTVNNSVTVKVSGLAEGSAAQFIAAETVGTVTIGDVLGEGFADSSGEFSFSQNYEGAFDPSGLDVTVVARNAGIATACIADDGGAFTDETTEGSSNATADMTLLPATPVANDAFQFGHQDKFGKLKLDISTALAFSSQPTVEWQYWSGSAWTALSGVTDGTSGFETSGENIVSWTIPGDWATRTDNSQGPFFYVRAQLTVLGTITTTPVGRKVTLDVTRYIPYTASRIIVSGTGLSDNAAWVVDSVGKLA